MNGDMIRSVFDDFFFLLIMSLWHDRTKTSFLGRKGNRYNYGDVYYLSSLFRNFS